MGSLNRKVVGTECLLNSFYRCIERLPEDQQNPTFHQFLSRLRSGIQLVKSCESINDLLVYRKCRYASQILNLKEKINGFMGSIPDPMISFAEDVMAHLKDLYEYLQPPVLTSTLNTMMLQEMSFGNLCRGTEMEEANKSSYHSSVRVTQLFAGLEKPVAHLKQLLIQSDVSVIGVHSMGGCGKTTLAMHIYNDPDIKDYFGNVHFITVSRSPNLKGIIETMWEKIVGRKKPKFENVNDARTQLKEQLFCQSKRTLMVLDDVWQKAHLKELLFEAPEFKTVITTRDSSIIRKKPCTELYQLPDLGLDDALSLFCLSAFGQTSIPSIADPYPVIQIFHTAFLQAQHEGLPLALKVIGSSFNGEPHKAWVNAWYKLSQEECLFRCLETSIDSLDDVGKECFLDLALFPENEKICAEALLDIWVYVRKLEWQDAFFMLLELASKNLLTISSEGSRVRVSDGNASELYFSQHDLTRDLAIYLGSLDSIDHRKRLFMSPKNISLPANLEMLNHRLFDAQVVSIHTGSMDENQFYDMEFPETEVLVLFFSKGIYFLPPFLKTMRKLKILMLCNLSSKRATIKDLDALSSLNHLKCIRLENLVAPTIPKQIEVIQKLDKLSLSLCEGFGNIFTFTNTNLQIFKLDHCHLVEKLPYDLGNLSSLRMLRLSALPGLKELPASIVKLRQLEFLDISLCEGLEELPEEIGQLQKLKEFDMRECSLLRRLPRSVCGLSSLKHVICDKKFEDYWERVKASSIPDLRVETVEVQFTLDWLDD